MLTDMVTERLQQAAGDNQLTFQSAEIGLSDGLHPRVVLRGAALADSEGAPILDVATVDLSLDFESIIFGQAHPRHIYFSGGLIDLVKNRDGSFDLGFQTDDAAVQSTDIQGFLAQMNAGLSHDAMTRLVAAQVDGLTVRYTDHQSNRSWTFDGGRFTLDRNRNGQVQTRLDLAVLTGRGDPATLAFSLDQTAVDRAAVTAHLDGIPAQDLAEQAPALQWLSLVDAPLSGSLRTELADGAAGPVNATLDFGQGQIRVSDDDADGISFSRAKTYFAYDPSQQRLDISEIALSSDNGAFEGQGYALLQDGQFIVHLGADQARLPSVAGVAPIDVAGLIMDLRLRPDPFKLEIGIAQAAIGTGHLKITGALEQVQGTINTHLDATIDAVDALSIIEHWPDDMRPRARGWFEKNITAGQLTDVVVGVRQRTGQDRRVFATFGFQDAAVGFLNALPPITDAQGHGSFDGQALTLSMVQGQVTTPDRGRVSVGGSTMTIPTFAVKPVIARFDLDIAGPIPAMLWAMDQRPFRLFSRNGRDFDLAEGTATVDLALAVPFKPKIEPSDVAYTVDATLTRVRSAVVVPNQTVTSDRLFLRADPRSTTLRGPVRVAGTSADITWQQKRGESASTLTAEAQVTDAVLRAFNVRLPQGMMRGTTQANIDLVLPRGGPIEFDISSTLVGAAVTIDGIGWSKPPSGRADFSVAGTLGATPSIDRIAVSAAGLQATGQMRFGSGRLRDMRLRDVRVGNWLQGDVVLTDRGAGRPLGVDLSGATVDLRRLPGFGRGGGNGLPPINGTMRRIVVSDSLSLTNAQIQIDPGATLEGRFLGRVNGGAMIRGRMQTENGETVLRISGNNAGAALRDAGLLRQADGGDLSLTLRGGGAGGWRGSAEIIDTRIIDAPAVASILSAISVVGILEQLDGRGLMMGEILADFHIKDDLFTLYSSSAVGPSLGLSLDGYINTRDKQMDLQGVVSPFYMVNAIGAIFTRRGEGLLGFNFTLQGPPDDIAVGVNPLSILTPGMFREIFRRAPPEVVE